MQINRYEIEGDDTEMKLDIKKTDFMFAFLQIKKLE